MRCSRRRPRSWFLGVHCLSARPPLLSWSLAGKVGPRKSNNAGASGKSPTHGVGSRSDGAGRILPDQHDLFKVGSADAEVIRQAVSSYVQYPHWPFLRCTRYFFSIAEGGGSEVILGFWKPRRKPGLRESAVD